MNTPKPPISKKPDNLPVSKQPTLIPRTKQKPTPIPRMKHKKQPTPTEETTKPKTVTKKNSCDEVMDDAESANSDRPFETLQKWNESLTNSVKRKKEAVRVSMEGRPLPVPVENEFYYMVVGRKEAEDLLEGHADGTFILRPSSQVRKIFLFIRSLRASCYSCYFFHVILLIFVRIRMSEESWRGYNGMMGSSLKI